MNRKWVTYSLGSALLMSAACGGSDGSPTSEKVGTTAEALSFPPAEPLRLPPVLDPNSPFALAGEELFDNARAFNDALGRNNGRACATCHVDDKAFTLLPTDVQARYAANPADPLFNRIDADDPTAATPTYDHVKLGLVRITLPLPDNMDLINEDGSQVVTPADRMFFVWRGVPTVENTFYTAPYQFDGRAATLEIQAQGAITAHMQGPQEPEFLLDLIAGYENTVFSSNRARSVAAQVADRIPDDDLITPEDLDATPGGVVYKSACLPCHGGAKMNTTNSNVLNSGFNLFSTYVQKRTPFGQPELVLGGAGPVRLNPDGNVFVKWVTPTGSSTPIVVTEADPQQGDLFMNVGFGGVTSLEQAQGSLSASGGVAPFFLPLGPDGSHVLLNSSVPLPQYRFRFYADKKRTKPVVDLPPIPAATGYPCNAEHLCGPVNVPVDANGLPIVGPNFFMQRFSTDPGRAGITGNPADFEAFKVPQLRGSANTAPYMHDNSLATLSDVVDLYSRFIIPAIAVMNLPATNPPEGPNLPPESLTLQQKTDLLTFLNTF